jgi:serine/threonine protein kinase
MNNTKEKERKREKLFGKMTVKRAYSKEELNPIDGLKFLDPPSSSAQNYIGEVARLLSEDDKIIHSKYPNSLYEYKGKLGDGSASKLYKAEYTDKFGYKKEVVIKRIPKNEEWRNELNVLKTLKGTSKKLINFLDYYESERCSYIITDLYQGFDLFEHIDINVPYPENYAKQLIKEMILCVKECHDKKIAHLDIKCENYMVRKVVPPELILIDFGHAEKIGHDTMKHGQSSYGTCLYLCPEGYKKYFSMKSDSWSIGICTHLLLTGDYPFSGDDDEYEEHVCKGDIKLSKNLSPGALEFLKDSLHYDPALRSDIYQLLDSPWLNNLW